MNRSTALSVLLAALCPLAAPGLPPAAADEPAATRPVTRPVETRPAIVQFQPGVTIDWSEPRVEIDVTVILRNGPIELFACSPKRREHEAIVRIEALPTHVYQAMGLIGLTPGTPAHLDAVGQVIPATGDPVDVEVRYSLDGVTRQEPIELWMSRAEDNTPLGRLPWVFAGSIPLESGKGIASDLEGTVVAVVDFPTSLIALPEHHTDRNEALWLRPNTERIPPVGTKGRMIIHAAPLRLKLGSGGRLTRGNERLTREELARIITDGRRENPRLRVEITVEPGTESEAETALIQFLQELKIPAKSITVLPTAAKAAR